MPTTSSEENRFWTKINKEATYLALAFPSTQLYLESTVERLLPSWNVQFLLGFAFHPFRAFHRGSSTVFFLFRMFSQLNNTKGKVPTSSKNTQPLIELRLSLPYVMNVIGKDTCTFPAFPLLQYPMNGPHWGQAICLPGRTFTSPH